MKIEIEFRGRCVKSGNLIYGDIIHGVGHKSGNVYILPSKINLATVKHCDPLDGVIVDTQTISQFTGKEISNEKIYTGDIVLVRTCEDPCIVIFDEDLFSFVAQQFSNNKNPLIRWAESLTFGLSEVYKKIGNIYENPEILNL